MNELIRQVYYYPNWQRAVERLGAPNRWQVQSVVKPYDQHPPSLWERVYRWIQRVVTGS